MESNEKGALEKARERLYAPSAPASDVRAEISRHESGDLPHAWEPEAPPPMKKHPHVQIAVVFFVVAFVFFLAAGAITFYFLYFGTNSVSTSNVDLSVEGPTALSGGDTLPLALSVTNRNPVAIENATIDVDFPKGTRSVDNVLQTYSHFTENVGTIEPGQTVTRTARAIIFGEQGSTVSIPLSVSFGTPNSNSTFVKRGTHDLSITSSPLSIAIAIPAQTVSGQTFTTTLVVRSNATTPIGNAALSVNYPSGFVVSSTSAPVENNLFMLGTLKPGDTRTISITGKLTSIQTQGAFHFAVGTTASPSDSTLAITYVSQESDIALSVPFINTALTINGRSAAPIVLSPGKAQSVTVAYTNTLSTAVVNAEVDVQVSGPAVDYNSIQVTRGFYRSTDHTIVFTRDSDPAMALLQAGSSGLGTFSFSTLASASVQNPTVTLTVSVSGTRSDQSNGAAQVNAVQVVTAKVASAVVLTTRSLHSSGPIQNTGPIPPTPGTPTTYTVLWTLQDSGNPFADAKVSTVLPGYVTYTGVLSPGAAITYNSATRTVLWSAGDLASGNSAQAGFQVSITPSTSQSSNAPLLTTSSSFSGFDRFAGVSISGQVDPVNTETTAEPGYIPANGSVR